MRGDGERGLSKGMELMGLGTGEGAYTRGCGGGRRAYARI